MPISLEAFATPKFIKKDERYPWSADKEDRFNEIYPEHFAGRYRGSEGREGGWKQAGYNPNHNSTQIEKIRVRSDNISMKPR